MVHATSTNPEGPYRFQDWIGPGHNPEIYQNAKGEYMIYTTHGRFFYSKSLEGPWKAGTYIFDKRGRYAFKNFVNFSFAPRDNGSHLAVARRGYIWASPDGRDHWYEVSSESIYPKVPGIFEDPVMWKDDVQYHIIVNDWKGRIAYYLRSKDGFHWKTEPGEAYNPAELGLHEDGTKHDWYKYERIRFLQDEHGRPTQAFFAVIDSDKHSDLPNDIHNSKAIAVPMRIAKLIEVQNKQAINASTSKIEVKIKAEKGFNPHTDLNLDSLRFGDSVEVNYGRGAKLLNTKKSGKDLVLVFEGKNSGLNPDNFAGKLLGKDTAGKIVYGWSRLPDVAYKVPVLSALSPKFEYTDAGLEAYIEVTNFGEVASKESVVTLLQRKNAIGTARVRPLAPFAKSMVRLVCDVKLPAGSSKEFTVLLQSNGLPDETFTKKVKLPK